MPYLRLSVDEAVATLTLDHDARRNALSSALIGEFLEALATCTDRGVRALVLRANAGAKVWSAGHDVNELPRSGRDPLSHDDPLEQLLRGVRKFPAPVLAMIDGSVWGGACELAVCCDIPIGTPAATFAITPARIGVPYNVAGLLRLMNEVDISALKEMFFTAKPISAERALATGLLNHLVAPEDLERFTYEMAATIASLAPLSITVIKEQIRLLANAHPLSPETFERIQGLRTKVFDSEDYREGITAFLEKRAPRWQGR